jgi:hypothetical protein
MAARRTGGTNHLDEFIEWVKEVDDKKLVYVRFPDLDSIVNMLINIDPHNTRSKWSDIAWQEFEVDTNFEWAGTRNMQDALHKLRYGWEEMAELMHLDGAARMVQRPIEGEFDIVRDTSGGTVDMGAYVSGVPENMLNFVSAPRPRRTVNLLYNVSATGGADTSYLKERGMQVTAICDYLERSGYRVRVDVADSAYGYSSSRKGPAKCSSWNLTFCAKDYTEQLDFGRIGFMLGSPAMLRRIFFGIESASSTWREDFNSHFGYVTPIHPQVGEHYDYVFDYINNSNAISMEDVISYIVTGISKQYDTTHTYGG